jgi:AcrR family transcriptional regulator
VGRPSTPLLSGDRIAKAALELVLTTGSFTIPAIARSLNVQPSSLYNHVAGRGEIIERLRCIALSGVELPEDDSRRPWRDAVAEVLRQYRRSFARYPRLIPLLAAHPVNSARACEMYNSLAIALRRGGFDPSDTLRAITTLDSFVLGAALDMGAPHDPWERAENVGPELRAALATRARTPKRADDAFEYGLEVMLRGLKS